MIHMDKIVKRDGRIVQFDREKIAFAVQRAFVAVGSRNKREADRITVNVVTRLKKREYAGTYPAVEEVQDLVELALMESGHAKTAKAYILYRYEHALKREGKKSLSYSKENIPYKKLWEALSWAVDNQCVTFAQLRTLIEEGSFRDLVNSSEFFYNSEIDAAAQNILERVDDLQVIIVSGPSSSGKTTTTIKLKQKLQENNVSLLSLNVDNYFLDLEMHPQDVTGDYDYETPHALDMKCINEDILRLLSGETINMPRYNFKSGKRELAEKNLRLENGAVILIDSLHGMHPEMTEDVPDNHKFKLYIETLSQIKDKNERFIRWADIRMLRRMVRDMQFRNYGPEQTIAHWYLVRRSELRYIISRLREADVIVNSSLVYELPVLKYRLGSFFPRFIENFRDDPNRIDAFERAQRVHGMLEETPEWENESVVPQNSLLREFIGGSIYHY